MFGSIKKILSGRGQPSSPLSDPVPCPRPQRRRPSTPPLPLRTLRLVAKPSETPVVLRNYRKVKGHMSGVRESWPGAGPMTTEPKCRMSQTSLTLPSWDQPIIEAQPRTTDQTQPQSAPPAVLSQNPLIPTAPHPPPRGPGSVATMMSLLLFCLR